MSEPAVQPDPNAPTPRRPHPPAPPQQGDSARSTSNTPALRHRHVIVAGFGIVGRMIVEQLEDAGLSVTVIDLNARTVDQQRQLNRTMILGDVCDPACLREARIDQADALIVTVPDEEQAIRACRVARELHPSLFIATRANFVSRGLMATEAGADCVVVEEIVCAEAMQQAVMQRLLGRNGSGPAQSLATFCPKPDHTGKPPR